MTKAFIELQLKKAKNFISELSSLNNPNDIETYIEVFRELVINSNHGKTGLLYSTYSVAENDSQLLLHQLPLKTKTDATAAQIVLQSAAKKYASGLQRALQQHDQEEK